MAKTYEELVAEAPENAGQTNVDEVKQTLDSGEKITVLDVREPAEWEEGHVPGATHLLARPARVPGCHEPARQGPAHRDPLCPRRSRSPRGQHPDRDGLHERRQHGGRPQCLAREGPRVGEVE